MQCFHTGIDLKKIDTNNVKVQNELVSLDF